MRHETRLLIRDTTLLYQIKNKTNKKIVLKKKTLLHFGDAGQIWATALTKYV